MNVYDLNVKPQDGGDISLSDYRGKVLLIVIVNRVTGRSLIPQHDEMQGFYKPTASMEKIKPKIVSLL